MYLSWIIFENQFGSQEQGHLSNKNQCFTYSLHSASGCTCQTELNAFIHSGHARVKPCEPKPQTAHETSNPYPVFADKAAGSFEVGTALGISLLSSPHLPSPAHPHWSLVGLLHQALLSPQRLGRVGMGRNCPGVVGSFHSVCPLRFPLSMGLAGGLYHPPPP